VLKHLNEMISFGLMHRLCKKCGYEKVYF